jgi:hypothetical protein
MPEFDGVSGETDNVVRMGGVAKDDAAAEDVTRDTYGFSGADVTSREGDPEEARRRADQLLSGRERLFE